MKKTRRIFFVLVLIFNLLIQQGTIFLVLKSSFKPKKVEADTHSLTTRADFDLGYFNNTESKSKEGEVKLEPDGAWGPLAWKTPNLTVGDQTGITSDGHYIYMTQRGDNDFLRYLPDENRWQTLATAPHFSYYGANLVVLGNYVYAIFGGYQKEFSRYSIIDDSWSERTELPDLVYSGASLTTDGTYIYCLRATGTGELWKYNPTADTWTPETTYTTTFTTGAGLVYYGSNLYALRGGGNTNIYRYNLSDHTWYMTTTGGATLASSPAGFSYNHTVTIKEGVIYTARDSNETSFYSYNITGNSWSTLATTPASTRYGGTVYVEDDSSYIYLFRGNNSYDFWKYDISQNKFIGPANLPYAANTGADLVYYNGYLYYNRGGGTNYYRYNISGDSWDTLTSSTVSLSDDAKGIAVGGYIYYLTANNTNTFYRYDVSGGSWESLSTTPATMRYGASLVYLDPYIYATRGNNYANVYRYTIGGSWDSGSVPNLPNDAEAYMGARLVTDGTSLYYSTGGGRSQLLKWTPGDTSWTVITSLPFAPYYGTDAAYYLDGSNKKIFFQAGYYKSDFWEYSITNDSWRKLEDLQSYYAYDLGPYGGGSLEVDSSTGKIYSILGNGTSWLNVYTSSSYNYPTSGTWTSSVMDLTYVSSWTSLEATTTTPSGTSISYVGRSSADQITWTDWETITSGVFPEEITANRYLQIKATLTADGGRTETPVLQSLTVNYEGDTSAPTAPNANTFHGYSQPVGGTELTSGTSYTYTQPYFSWGAAADSETDISGYYVYYGTNQSANPVDDGAFQTSTNYLATLPMTNDPDDPDDGSYYLIVKAKNASSLTSDSFTVFTYVYNNVSPPISATYTTTTDFTEGTADDVSVTSDEIKLSSKDGFWLEERLSALSVNAYYGTDMAYISSTSKFYLMPSTNSSYYRRVYEYDIATDTFTLMATSNPAGIANGSTMVEGPDDMIYAFRGGNNNAFWLYDPSTDTWNDPIDPLDAPFNTNYGASLSYDSDHYIYALRGANDDAFYRYDTDVDTWEQLANADFGAPTEQYNNVISAGGDLAYDGENSIYAIQGGTRSGFAVYDTGSDSWTNLAKTPASSYYGAKIEYDSTTNSVYYMSGYAKPFFYKYDVSEGTWTRLSDAPGTIYYGAGMRIVGDYIYVVRGNNTTSFYKYSISKDSWLTPTVGLFGGAYRGTEYRTYGYGTDIIKGDGNNYYMTRGNFDNLFYRYNPVTGTTTKMADAPFPFYYGSELVYDSVNNKIYATGNVYYRKFFVYDIATNVWTEDTSNPPPYDSANSSAMTFDSENKDIYWVRAGGTQTFYKYDTDAGSNNWGSALTNTPGAIGWGGDLLYKDGLVYTLQGNNNIGFYAYDINGTAWVTGDSEPTDLPTGANVNNEGFLVDSGSNYLYACRGGNNYGCYRYSVSGNSWEAIANAPANIYYGAGAASNGSDKMYVIAGPGTNTYSNGVYTYVMQTDSSSFEESGSYTSPVHSLGATYRFAGLKVSYTSATNASLTVQTRTSADNQTWTDWASSSLQNNIDTTYYYKINSTVNPYIQVKLTLASSDGVYSGVVRDYTIDYYSDTDAPQNPTHLDSYSTSTQSATITSNTWYNFGSPNFDWPDEDETEGATDQVISGKIGSGVAGYYVYFGTDSDVNASESGTLVTTSSYTASSLTSNQTYYLRIQTVDNAGNFSEENWQAFTYRYDGDPPENPTTVVVNPSGYTNVNDYTFTWSGATDSASLVKQYWYKAGPSGTESATLEATASGVLKYQTGTNTFYLQAQDYAGNRAASWVTASYYYNGNAPSVPQNLRVTYPSGSTSNTVNEFAFAWDPPTTYYGQQSALRYYYWINRLPSAGTAENSTSLAVSYLSKGGYAQDPGENTLYVVAEDEAGNIDYDLYASITFTSSTSAPGQPRNIDISDVSIKETSAWRLALSWDTPSASGSGIAEYRIYRSATTGAECPADPTSSSDFSYVASTTQTSYVDTGLTQTTKYYCVTACNYTGGKGCGVASDTVSLYPDGRWRVSPDLTASPSATVKTKTATIAWSTARTANSFVKYGTSSGSYGDETGSSTQVTSHSVDLTGLEPGTTYYFKCLWTDEDGNTGESDEITFTTNPAPYVSSVKFTNVNINTAYVVFTIKNANKASIEYGKTISYGSSQSMSTSTSETTYTVQLTDLIEGTIYHLRIAAEDEEANTYYSDDYSFETLPTPKILNLKIQQVVGMPTSTLRLVWTSNTLITSIVTYYPTNYPERAADQISLVYKKSHDVILKNLLDNTDYTIIIKGKDSAGNDAKSETKLIKTANDVRAPEIQNMNVESSIDGVGDTAKAQIVVTWDTDEPATTQVEYAQGTGTSYGQSTQEDSSLTTNHAVTITNLTPAKIYHLRALSKDKVGNLGASFDTVIITPKSTKDALNLVIENLSKTFGFLNNLSIGK